MSDNSNDIEIVESESTNSYPNHSKVERFLTSKEDKILNMGLKLTDVLGEVVKYLNNTATDFNYYKTEEVDSLLSDLKLQLEDTLALALEEYYTKEEVDDLLTSLSDEIKLEIDRLDNEDERLQVEIDNILELIGDLSLLNSDIYTDNSSVVNALNSIAGVVEGNIQDISDLQDGIDALDTLIKENTDLITALDSRVTSALITINEALATIQEINTNVTEKLSAQDDRITILETSISTTITDLNTTLDTFKDTLDEYNTRIEVLETDMESVKDDIESILPNMDFFDTFDSESVDETKNKLYSGIIEDLSELFDSYSALALRVTTVESSVSDNTTLLEIINRKLFEVPIDIDTYDESMLNGWFESTIKSILGDVESLSDNFDEFKTLVMAYFTKLGELIKEDGDKLYILASNIYTSFPSTNVYKNVSGLVDPDNATNTLPHTYASTGSLFINDNDDVNTILNVILGRNRQTVARLEEIIILLDSTIESIPNIPDIPEDLSDELAALKQQVDTNVSTIEAINENISTLTELVNNLKFIEVDDVTYIDGTSIINFMSDSALETFNTSWLFNEKFTLDSNYYSVSKIVDILYKRINKLYTTLSAIPDINALISRVDANETDIETLKVNTTNISFNATENNTIVKGQLSTDTIAVDSIIYKNVEFDLGELYASKITNTVNDTTNKISDNMVSIDNNAFQVFMKPRNLKSSQLSTNLLSIEPTLNISSAFDVLEGESNIIMDYTINVIVSGLAFITAVNSESSYEFRIIGGKDFMFGLFKDKVLTNTTLSSSAVDFKGVSYTITPSLSLSTATSSIDESLSTTLDANSLCADKSDGIYITRGIGTFNTKFGNFDQVELVDGDTFETLRNAKVGDFTSRLNLFSDAQSNLQIDSGIFNLTIVGGDSSLANRNEVVLTYKTRVEFLKLKNMKKLV